MNPNEMRQDLGITENDQDMQGENLRYSDYQPQNPPDRPPQEQITPQDAAEEQDFTEQEQTPYPEQESPSESEYDFFRDQQQPQAEKEQKEGEMDWTFTLNGTTYEVPEKFRAFAKDRDSAEFIKNSVINETLRQDRESEIQRQSQGYEQYVQDMTTRDNAIQEAVKHNDIEFVANKLGIPLETIYSFVENKIKEQITRDEGGYVPPQQTKDYEAPYTQQQQQLQLRQREIDMEFQNDSQLQQLQSSFDQTNGQGALMNQLYQEGRYLEETVGRSVSVREAIDSLKRKLSPYLGPQQAQTSMPQTPQAPIGQPIQQQTGATRTPIQPVQRSGIVRQRKPYPPKPGGKTGISLRKKPKDLEQLEEMVNNNNNMLRMV